MSAPAFTPAPWKCERIPEGAEFEVLDREGGYICGVAFDADGPSPAQALADAHLIAAAPELFEALRGLVNVTVGPMTPEMAAALDALTKAQGEQS